MYPRNEYCPHTTPNLRKYENTKLLVHITTKDLQSYKTNTTGFTISIQQMYLTDQQYEADHLYDY